MDDVLTQASRLRVRNGLLAVQVVVSVVLLTGAARSLSRKTILTCSLPMTKNDSRMVLGLTTSGAEHLAARRRKAHVVSAFGTAPSEVLFSVFEKRRRKTRSDLVFCGDHDGAKRTAANLIRDVGFNPVDLGDLTAARYIEPFSLLLAEIAYKGSEGGELACRFVHLSRRGQIEAHLRPRGSSPNHRILVPDRRY